MSYERLAYADQDTTPQMHSDCTACASEIARPRDVDVSAALDPAPSIDYSDFPAEQRKPVITVSDATAHLAARLHLHLD